MSTAAITDRIHRHTRALEADVGPFAAGDIDVPALADWLRRHVTALEGDVDVGPVA